MNKVKSALFAAALSLAISLTFSCSADESGQDTFKDSRDGKTYGLVKIGGQVWMAKNLNYKTDGGKCGGDDFSLKDENTAACDAYGRLYNWEAARTACPDGWHLPSDEEWAALVDYAGEDVAAKLKAKSGWGYSNGTDDFGFSALPSGEGNSNGAFDAAGDFGYWWSSTDGGNVARIRHISYGSTVQSLFYDKSSFLSVRCLRD